MKMVSSRESNFLEIWKVNPHFFFADDEYVDHANRKAQDPAIRNRR